MTIEEIYERLGIARERIVFQQLRIQEQARKLDDLEADQSKLTEIVAMLEDYAQTLASKP